MTELEEARAHLRVCQETLSLARRKAAEMQGGLGPWGIKNSSGWIAKCETAVLAALSWVWDAQERAAGPCTVYLSAKEALEIEANIQIQEMVGEFQVIPC